MQADSRVGMEAGGNMVRKRSDKKWLKLSFAKAKLLPPAKKLPNSRFRIAAQLERGSGSFDRELADGGRGDQSAREMKSQYWRFDWQQNKFSRANCNAFRRCRTCS